MKNSLYQKKRNFSKTDEPTGSQRARPEGWPIYVVQKHDATNLHYDMRLQIGDVLKSWAIPKGPSTDPREKRLAIETEDHPLDYADYEGVIPDGEYGAGTVLVWDKGTYENRSTLDGRQLSAEDAFTKGEIIVNLHGYKLQGEYALIKTNSNQGQWLLVKKRDSHADARRNPVSTEQKSVISGRTLKGVKKEEKND